MQDKTVIIDQRPTTNDQRPTTNDQRPTTNDPNNVLVSIIIPAYNTAPYIQRAIESSQRQSHTNVEIIIIDDGSTDDTLKVSQSYAEKDSRIKVIHQENAGVSSARNHGMREANGEYYVFLDSDDWLEDNAVEILLDSQMKYPDKLIAANFFMVSDDNMKKYADNERIKSHQLSIESFVKCLFESVCKTIDKELQPMSIRYPFAKMFRADICRKGVIFPEGEIYGEDTFFVFDYLNAIGGAFYINRPVVDYLKRSSSVTNSKSSEISGRKLQSNIATNEMMINHPNNTPEAKKYLRMRTCIVTLYLLHGSLWTESDAQKARQYIKKYAPEYLTSERISPGQKLLFILKVYPPFPVSKAIFRTLQSIKKIRDKMRRK